MLKRFPSCISLEELIDKDKLQAACVFAFFIRDQSLLPYLLTGEDSTVPVSLDSLSALPILVRLRLVLLCSYTSAEMSTWIRSLGRR